jgi:hypothetical protein
MLCRPHQRKPKSRCDQFVAGGISARLTGHETSEGTMGTILVILLILLLIGALPTWPYSSGWGYYPSGGLGLVLLIIIILVLFGRV